LQLVSGEKCGTFTYPKNMKARYLLSVICY
jgi:hypothetical protein